MINKNGNIRKENIYESDAMNILVNSEKYTKDSPYVLTSASTDGYRVTGQYCRVEPGKTYYYTTKTDTTLATKHPGEQGKCSIWLYFFKTYDPSINFETLYATTRCFNSTTYCYLGDYIWKYTIPEGYNMACVRYNIYSNGTDKVTAKFWDTKLIPVEYYTSKNPSLSLSLSALQIGKDFISTGEIMEY